MPADYRGQHLSGHDFSRQALRRAEFFGANLRGATFAGAICRGADFRRANLENANFTDCDTAGADFRFANLRGIIGLRAQRDIAAEVLAQRGDNSAVVLAMAWLLKRFPETRGADRPVLGSLPQVDTEPRAMVAILREAGFA